MMNTLGLQASPVLAPTLSPRLQKAVRLLQLSSLDFCQVVRQAIDTNPFLEPLETGPPEEDTAGPADPEWAGAMRDGEEAQEASPAGDAPSAEGAWENLSMPRTSGRDEGAVFDTLVAPTALADHLVSQLRVLRLSLRDQVLAEAVARNLDDDGYLRVALEELGAALVLSPPPDPQELVIALRHVQALEPTGVGARSLAECLLLQIAQWPATPAREVARGAACGPGCGSVAGPMAADAAVASLIVRDHLPALAGRDLASLARRLRQPREAVEAACAAIRRLDPRPGWRLGGSTTAYVTPDVIVRRQRGQWVATLNPAVVPRVRLHHAYAQWFQHHREAGQAGQGELGAALQEARWTVRNVEQRFTTILAVARAILQRQHRFLAYGPMAMKPLALREIAQAVGVHESTVSRVTNNKFMATPSGVFELKYFFSRGLATASGTACSPTAVRGLIRDLIAAEAPGQPLSDVALARTLAQQGLQVARRTVTKYRQQLRIEPAERRYPTIR